MGNSSKSNRSFRETLSSLVAEGALPQKLKENLESFYLCFREALKESNRDPSLYEEKFFTFLELVRGLLKEPFAFSPFHTRIRKPFDYYAFGNEFVRPLVDLPRSRVLGKENLDEISGSLSRGENVILLANHQTEADPQAISLLLNNRMAEEMIFVAGERVVTDPLAVPFSMGRNLLCIYSKRYIDHPPEEKAKKQLHNKRTMQLMSELLSEGGKCIYVAPSGGRDRKNAEGVVEIAPFDPQSIEMFYLMAQRAEKPTHFYPLALATYDLMPPPAEVQIELGEKRIARLAPIGLAFGKRIDMEHFPRSELEDKHARRKARADTIWKLVRDDYEKLISNTHSSSSHGK